MFRLLSGVLFCLLAICILADAACAGIDWTPAEQEWMTKHVGVYMWGPGGEGAGPSSNYNRVESGIIARRLGTRIIRTYLSGYDGADTDVVEKGQPPRPRTYVDYLASPTYRRLINDFDVIIFTVSFPAQAWQPDWIRVRYREITEFLLRTYQHKTFVLGNWEGDYWCPGEHTWDQAIAMWNARHDGVVDGRMAVPKATTKVYDMIEMVLLDFNGKEKMINNLAPYTRADLYSLSAWGYYGDLTKAVNYMKTKCPDSPDFGNDNVMIGEIGCSSQVPADRIRFFHDKLLELRDVKVPFAIIWALHDNGLSRAKSAGGHKLASFYQLSRAYRSQDSNLLVDDFEVDPLGLAGGEQNEDGYSMNNLGGIRSAVGDADAAHVQFHKAWDRKPSRVLKLTVPQGATAGSGWEEQLLGLNALRFTSLGFRAKGDLSSFDLILTDTTGKNAKVNLADYHGSGWQCVSINRLTLKGVDWKNLDSIRWLSRQPGRARILLLDTVWFCRLTDDELRDGPATSTSPQIDHVVLRRSLESLPHLSKIRSVTLTTVATEVPVFKPALSGANGSVLFADSLGAMQSISVSGNGKGEVQMGPLYHRFLLSFFPRAGITLHNLDMNKQYGRLYPATPDQAGYLEWWFSSPHPVTGFEFILHGADNRPAGGEMGISYSTDGVIWQKCAITRGDSVWPHIVEGVIGKPPAGFTPSSRIGVRFWIKTASTAENWYWNASIADIQAHLDLDTSNMVLPQRNVLYTDDSPSLVGYRGLLNID